MKDSLQTIAAFLGGALIAIFILWAIVPTKEKPVQWDRLSDKAVIERMEEASLSEVERYVEMIHKQPLGAAYVIPAHVANAANVHRANAAVEHQYAEFAGKYNEDLFTAVQHHPLLYREYIQEKLAVRQMFENRNQTSR